MWNNSVSESDNVGGGGFYDTTNKFDSPGGTDKKQDGPRKAQSVTPIVISMITNNEDEEFAMWGHPITMIKVVCIVRKFDVTSTTVSYEVEDHTGTIKAVLWLEHDSGSAPNIPVDKENVYVKIFGTIRSKGDEKVLMILKIAPIDHINEITTHNLETIFVRVMQEKRAKGEEVSIKANNPGAQLSNSMMSYGGMEEVGMAPMQKGVFQFMRQVGCTDSTVGISRNTIHNNFPPTQKRDVDNAISFLVSEGHIFSTIDNDHFQLTAA